MQPGWKTVEAVVDTGRLETVYNLEIEGDHTYFVGCDEWGFSVWAHNACEEFFKELELVLGKQAKQGGAAEARAFKDAIEAAVNGNEAKFKDLLTKGGVQDAEAVKRLYDAARKPLPQIEGEIARVGADGRLRVTNGLKDLDPPGSIRITHPNGDDFLIRAAKDGEVVIEVGLVNSQGTHAELLRAAVEQAKQMSAKKLTYNSGVLNDMSGPIFKLLVENNQPLVPGTGTLRRVGDGTGNGVFEADFSNLLTK